MNIEKNFDTNEYRCQKCREWYIITEQIQKNPRYCDECLEKMEMEVLRRVKGD